MIKISILWVKTLALKVESYSTAFLVSNNKTLLNHTTVKINNKIREKLLLLKKKKSQVNQSQRN